MGLLDVMTDPFGMKYKKPSWNQHLGITGAKRSLNKTFIQPFSKLNPMWHLRNMKRSVKRKLGFNSEIAKAYRSGKWGKYMKRKVFGESSGMIMPFMESQFTPYDMQSNPFDKEQTGPDRKGLFAKLSKYAAPGAVAGLALLASKKFNLLNKLRGAKTAAPKAKSAMDKIKAGGIKLMRKIKSGSRSAVKSVKGFAKPKYKAVKKFVKSTAKNAWEGAKLSAHAVYTDTKNYGEERLGELRNKFKPKLSVNPKGPKQKSGRNKHKTVSELIADPNTIKTSATTGLIMPFRESRYGTSFNHDYDPAQRKASLVDKIVTAGAVGVAALGAWKLGHALSDGKKLALKADEAYQKVKHFEKKQKALGAFSIAPGLQIKAGYAQMKHDAYNAASGITSMFRSPKSLDSINKAVKMAKFKRVQKQLFRGMTVPATKEMWAQLQSDIMTGQKGWKTAFKNKYNLHVKGETPPTASPHQVPAAETPKPHVEVVRTHKPKRAKGTFVRKWHPHKVMPKAWNVIVKRGH